MEDTPRLFPDNGEVSGLEHQDGELSQSSSTSSADNLYAFHDNEETFDDLNSSVQDLLSRYRGGPSPQPKKRDRALSPTTDSHDSPKRRSLTEGSAEAGKDDLMAMIRQTRTSSTEDIDQGQPNESESMPVVRRRSRQGSHPGGLLISQVTAELVKKFESGKEPEEKKPRSSEPLLVKTGALHDPDDLDSSHVGLQDDLDPKPSLASAEGQVSLHDDLENDIEEYVEPDHKENTDLAENFDLDSSGSVDQLNMMKSGSFSEEPNALSNTMSLADELQQANAADSSDSELLSSGDQGQYNITEYTDQNEEAIDEKRYSEISNEGKNEEENEENEEEMKANSSDESSEESDSDSVEEYDVTTTELVVTSVNNDADTSELTSSELQESEPITAQPTSELAEEAIEEPGSDEEKPGEVAVAPIVEDQADQISIRPYKCPQDHENLDINVKSLVHLFEEEDGQDDVSKDTEESEARDGNVAGPSGGICDQRPASPPEVGYPCSAAPARSATDSAELPDIVVCSERKKSKTARVRFEDDFYEPVVILPQSPKPNHPGKFVKNWENDSDYGNDVRVVNDNHSHKFNVSESSDCCTEPADASLLEALKDILDRTSHYKHNLNQTKDKKVKRVKFKDKRGSKVPQKAFKDKVDEIFSPGHKPHYNRSQSTCGGDSPKQDKVLSKDAVCGCKPQDDPMQEDETTECDANGESPATLNGDDYTDKVESKKLRMCKENSEKEQLTACKEKTKEESSLDGTDLDFSVLQSSQQLNVDITKQRITLRQKGSLAKRRKPTRTSVRSLTNPETILFTDSTEPRRAASPEEDENDRVEEMSPRERLAAREQQVTRSSSMPADRRSTQPRPAPVLLPGLGDHIKRRTRAPIPLPKPTEQSKPPSETSPPPWMAEVRVRRGSRPLKADLERAPSEPRNPESPSWMRDALSKKKRAAELLEQRNSSQVETEQPTVPPWMKELRRTPRQIVPPPVSNNNGHTSSSEATPTTQEQPTHISNHNNFNASRQESFQSPFETRSKGREVLAPIKRSSVDNSAQPSVMDNRLATPPYLGTSNGQVSEIMPNKNVLPPLKSTSQSSTSQDNQENSESPVPTWRKEIAARRKSKTFVPAIKPETPLKLGDMPAWKRELAERNKIKKRDSIDIQSIPSPTPPPSSATSSPSLLPWQQELAQRRKRTPSITRQPTTESPNNKDDTPSWARNVERRRARLADCGLIDNSIDEKSG